MGVLTVKALRLRVWTVMVSVTSGGTLGANSDCALACGGGVIEPITFQAQTDSPIPFIFMLVSWDNQAKSSHPMFEQMISICLGGHDYFEDGGFGGKTGHAVHYHIVTLRNSTGKSRTDSRRSLGGGGGDGRRVGYRAGAPRLGRLNYRSSPSSASFSELLFDECSVWDS